MTDGRLSRRSMWSALPDIRSERIEFGAPTRFSVDQNEFAWFAGDQWRPGERVSVDLGLRFDRDSITRFHACRSTGRRHLCVDSRSKDAAQGRRRAVLRSRAAECCRIPRFPVPHRAIPGRPGRCAGLHSIRKHHLRSAPKSAQRHLECRTRSAGAGEAGAPRSLSEPYNPRCLCREPKRQVG